ncbi:MAG: MBL fold metallo-hydrolase [Flavobacterium sp.]|nr:MBL fold metallo-hydrolase [Flavobacterium sp.]
MKNLIIISLTAVLTFTGYGQNKDSKTTTSAATTFQTINKKGLTLDVYFADENKSFGVASVIISGKSEVVLIDAQFSLPDAEKVAQKVKSSGKKLTTIFVSFGDPDYYFGLEVFKKYFPEVTVFAVPTTIAHIKETYQNKLDFWGPILGDFGTKNIVLPQVLKGNSITLDGEKIEIIGLKDFPDRTFVWIPSIKATLGGINVFGDTFHLWMADAQTTESRSRWASVLEKIEALNPEIVIPGHAKAGASLNLVSVKYTKEYVKIYEEALKTNKTSEELVKFLKSKFPNATFEAGLVLSAKVNTGEMKW